MIHIPLNVICKFMAVASLVVSGISDYYEKKQLKEEVKAELKEELAESTEEEES